MLGFLFNLPTAESAVPGTPRGLRSPRHGPPCDSPHSATPRATLLDLRHREPPALGPHTWVAARQTLRAGCATRGADDDDMRAPGGANNRAR